MAMLRDHTRLATLQPYHTVGMAPEPAFERIARLAAQCTGAPFALVTLIDEATVWCKAHVGLEVTSMPAEESFCTHTLADAKVLVVEDATADPRFSALPLVTDAPGVRFYAGAPLVAANGAVLGALCVMDAEPRRLSAADEAALQDFAALVMDELNLHRRDRARGKMLESITDAFYALDANGRFTFLNKEAERLLQRPREDLLGAYVWAAFPEAEPLLRPAYEEAVAQGEPQQITIFYPPLHTWFKVKAFPYKDGLSVYFEDVTEAEEARRWQAEQEVRLERKHNLLHQTQRLAGAWQVNLESNTVEWSEEVYRIHELSPDTQITVDQAIGFYTEEARAILQEAFAACIERGETYDLELPITTATGRPRWVRTVGGPIVEAENKIRMVGGAVQDVTVRYESQRRLRASEARLRGIADSMPGIIFQYVTGDETGLGELVVFGQARNILGYPPEVDDLNAWIKSRIPEPYRTAHDERGRHALKTLAPWHSEFPFDHPDGTRLWLQGTAMPVETDEGVVFNGVMIDITQRKNEEHAREAMRERMQLALDRTRAVVFDLDLTTGTASRTGAIQDVYQVDPADLSSGRSFYETVIHPDDQQRVRAKADALRQGTIDAMQVEFRTHPANGPVQWVREDVSRVPASKGRGPRIIGIGYEITEQKAAEEALRAAKEEAETLNRLKTALLTNMSHEIRTPLTGIIGYAELLDDVDPGPEAAEFARAINRSGQRLLRTLSSLLDLSQLEAGAIALGATRFDARASIQAVQEDLQVRAAGKGLQLSVVLPEHPVEVRTDRNALHRILTNLLSNAVKFTSEGSVTVELETSSDDMLVHVHDTGVGIDEAFLPRLFVPFAQESDGLQRNFEGSGLGLSITHQLVGLLGGTMDVASEKGVGTTFTVRLPRRLPEDVRG